MSTEERLEDGKIKKMGDEKKMMIVRKRKGRMRETKMNP